MKSRRIGVAALLVLATLLWVAAGFSLWAKRQALDTDNWVNTSSELLEDEEIRTALGTFIVNELFQSAEVQTRIEDALPTQLQPLAGPAAAGLKEVAQRSAPDLLGSAPALQAWETANEVAHSKLLAVLEGNLQDQGVALELKTLFQQIADSTGLPSDLADRLPPEVASLQVVKPDELETAQEAVDLFQTLVWVLVVLAVLAFAGAIALSPDRRRTVVTVGGCLVFAGVAIFAFRRLAENAVVDALADSPNASAIGDNVWEISTSLLGEVAQGTLLFGLFVMAGAWLAGAGRRATALRRVSAYALREHPGWTRAALGAANPAAGDLGARALDPALLDDPHLHGPRVRVARVAAPAHRGGVPRPAAATAALAAAARPGRRRPGERARAARRPARAWRARPGRVRTREGGAPGGRCESIGREESEWPRSAPCS